MQQLCSRCAMRRWEKERGVSDDPSHPLAHFIMSEAVDDVESPIEHSRLTIALRVTPIGAMIGQLTCRTDEA